MMVRMFAIRKHRNADGVWMTQFTLGWKVAIIVALVASFAAIGRLDKHTFQSNFYP